MRRLSSFGVQLFLALFIGVLVGLYFGARAAPLGQVGTFIIQSLKILAPFLIFFAILDSFCKITVSPRKGAELLMWSTVNAIVALVISLGVSTHLPAKNFVTLETLKQAFENNSAASQSPLSSTPAFVPQNSPSSPPLFLISIFVAIALGSFLKYKSKTESKKFTGLRVIEVISKIYSHLKRILHLIVHFIPLAVFCVVAKIVGTQGLSAFKPLAFFVGIVTLGLSIHVLIYYSLLLKTKAGKSPFQFFREATPAFLTSMGTGSSMATLPVTLETLQNRMHISEDSATLAACVGTNLNHDGILLYEAVAALFVAQIQGLDLLWTQKLNIALTSVAAAAGIGGIPDAGLITLSLVLGAAGLPLAAVPFLLPVDWFIGRLRATTNVASDMVVATLLDN